MNTGGEEISDINCIESMLIEEKKGNIREPLEPAEFQRSSSPHVHQVLGRLGNV